MFFFRTTTPEPEPEPEPEPAPKLVLGPEPTPKLDPEPEPELVPTPKSKPGAEPAPDIGETAKLGDSESHPGVEHAVDAAADAKLQEHWAHDQTPKPAPGWFWNSQPQPQPPEPQPEPAAATGPHYTTCYELTYVMLDKKMSPCDTALRQLVWLPERHSPCPSKVLVMVVYPTWQQNAPTSLLDDMVTMALGSPFANPIDVPIRSRRTTSSSAAGTSPGTEPTAAVIEATDRTFDESLRQRKMGAARADTFGLELDEDATFNDDEDEKAFQTPRTIRNIEDDAEANESSVAPRLSLPNNRESARCFGDSSNPTESPAVSNAGSEFSLPSLRGRIVQRGTEWATHKITHVTGQIEKYAERKWVSRQVPFSGVVVFEVDWDLLTGFEYWNQLVQEGRMCMETNRVRKCRFNTLEHAVRHYKLSPTSECALRCGLGVERDPRSEIFNQPQLLTDEQLLKRNHKRMSHEGSSWRYIAWPQWDGEDDRTPQCSRVESDNPVEQQLSRKSPGSCSSDGHSPSHSNNSVCGQDKELRLLDAAPKLEPVSAQMLAIYFTCPFLPGAAGRLMLLPERSKILRNYEAGLPGWAVNLATNRFVPNLPWIGVWYRPRMRTLLTTVIIIVQVVSMICGFYDLWRNIPFIQPTLILIWTPVYNWVIGPVASVLSGFFSSIFSAFITSGCSSLFSGIYHVFSFVLAPMISAMFMAFQPLAALFSPLAALMNTVLRTVRTFTSVLLSGPRLAITSLSQLLLAVGALLRPFFDLVAMFVKAFGGMVSGLVAFPFQLLLTLLRPLLALGTLVVRVLSTVLNPLRRLMGFGASSAQVVNTVSTFQKLQELWTTVLRPIKAVVKSVYDTVIMITTKLLQHRLTLERLIESKRSKSRITRAILSREAAISVRCCCWRRDDILAM